MLIGGIEKTTFIDYPGKIAAVIFTIGCPLRCTYCHNPELVIPEQYAKPIPTEDILQFLQKRQGKLEGVCISGGEPLLQKNLRMFLQQIKNLGFAIKLDTNGFFPTLLEQTLADGTVDYIAMDIKGPLASYSSITQTKDITDKINASIELIMTCGVDYEFRTTVAQEILTVPDFEDIGLMIKNAKHYFIQNYVRPPKQVCPEKVFTPFSYNQLQQAKETIQKYVSSAQVRNHESNRASLTPMSL